MSVTKLYLKPAAMLYDAVNATANHRRT